MAREMLSQNDMRQLAIFSLLLAATAVACGSNTDTAGSNASNVNPGDAGVDAAAIHSQALSYAREDIACTQDSDCCVVFDMCKDQGLIVGAKDQSTVTQLIAEWNQVQASTGSTECYACIAPAIDVSCSASGFCVGAKLGCAWDAKASANHCGRITTSDGGCPTAKPQSTEPKAPSKHPETVIGCGT
jgi:hypothetical protein